MDNDGDIRRTYEEASLEHHAKLIEYQAKLDRYNRDLDYWNSISQHERDELNNSKENSHRIVWTTLFILVSAFILLLLLKQKYSGDMLWMVWGGSSFFIGTISVILYRVIGVIVRGFLFGLLMSTISYLILHYIFEKHGQQLSWVGILVISIWIVGFIGGVFFRADASPKKPSRPATPKRSYYK